MDQTVIATAPRQSTYFLGSGTAHFTVRGPSASAAASKALAQGWHGVDYVLRLTCSSAIGGSAMDGNILRRTITKGEPQQGEGFTPWGRSGCGIVILISPAI